MTVYVSPFIAEQKEIEHKFSKHNIRKAIRKHILESEGVEAVLEAAEELLTVYMNTEYYESKNARMAALKLLDPIEITLDVLSITIFLDKPVLLTQVAGEIAGKLGFDLKIDGVKTAAEILGVLAPLKVYSLIKDNAQASIKVESLVQPPKELVQFIKQTKYLPPMICSPSTVRSNYDSGYLTKKESLILGSGNHHEGDICLDSINRFNQIPLTLNTQLLTTYSEPPTDFDTPEKRQKWEARNPGENWEMELEDRRSKWESMVRDSYQVYLDLITHGNEFWITHKVDKRGRTYAQGYHLSTQANSFRKAIIDLANKEVIEGV